LVLSSLLSHHDEVLHSKPFSSSLCSLSHHRISIRPPSSAGPCSRLCRGQNRRDRSVNRSQLTPTQIQAASIVQELTKDSLYKSTRQDTRFSHKAKLSSL